MLESTKPGRGNLAGSLIFCGARLKDGVTVEEIAFANDSKSMSKKKRKELYDDIIKLVDYTIIEIYPDYIDKNGISESCSTSLKYIKNYFKNLGSTKILYDGKTTFKVQGIETLVKADAKVSIVAAASIIAKVEKDLRMLKWHKKYPEYDWENNAGYLTEKHKNMVIKYGYTPQHRRSFKIKAFEGLVIKDYED